MIYARVQGLEHKITGEEVRPKVKHFGVQDT